MTSEPHERRLPFSGRDARRMILAGVLMILAVGATVALDFVPTGVTYATGAVAPVAIRAPQNAIVENPVETKQARDAAAAAVTSKYDYTAEKAAQIASAQDDLLRSAFVPVDNAFLESVAEEARQTMLSDPNVLPGLSIDDRRTLQSLTGPRWQAVRQAALRVLDSAERAEIKDSELALVRTSLPSQYMPAGLSTLEQQLVTDIVSSYLVSNSSYSDALTKQAQQDAANAVQPVYDTIQANEVIVDQGHVISAADMVKIDALGLGAPKLDWSRLGAWMLLYVLVVVLLLAWVWRFRPEYWHRNRTLWLIGLLFVVTVVVIKLAAGRPTLPYLVPTAAAAMLLTALLDAATATVLIAVLAAVAGAVNGLSLELQMYVFMSGFAGILTIRRGDRLQYFIQAGLAVAAAGVVVVGIFTMLGRHDMTGLLQLCAVAAVSAAVAAVLTIGSFAVLGNVFDILTGFQLLELANPSQPLLKRLLTETPGTYHHALMVGNLAERAASAIGADPLLTRVAAYYHDVGKLANPLAFIENQASGDNIHDQLDPEVSAAILKEHVPDGIDLAYKAKLPKPLIAFIPQHHGTALLSYFYAKARETAAEPFGGLSTAAGAAAADAVDQRRFRHAGPKPQSREAALLMLADGIEASVRSLSSRDEASIRAMVKRIIDERLQDGQLDDSNLTIRDLENAREAFVQQLLGMYHQRIAYPQNKIVELETRRERGLG